MEEVVVEHQQPIQKTYTKHEGEYVQYVLKGKNGKEQIVNYKKKKYISEEMKQDMRNMLAAGEKRKNICLKYNITLPTLKRYIG